MSGSGVQPNPIQPLTERVRHGERGPYGIVVEVDERDDPDRLGHASREGLGRSHRVASVGRNEGVRHRSQSLRSPPRSLSIGRYPDRARDVGRPAVTRLNHPVIVPRRKKHDCLRPGRLNDFTGIGSDLRTTAEHAEVERFEVGERRIGTRDVHDRIEWQSTIPVTQRPDLQIGPRESIRETQLEDCHGFVRARHPNVLLLEYLHRDHRRVLVGQQHLAHSREVLIAVVARPHLLDGELEDGRVQAFGGADRWRRPLEWRWRRGRRPWGCRWPWGCRPRELSSVRVPDAHAVSSRPSRPVGSLSVGPGGPCTSRAPVSTFHANAIGTLQPSVVPQKFCYYSAPHASALDIVGTPCRSYGYAASSRLARAAPASPP